MGDCIDRRGEAAQFFVAERQRVASAQDDLADIRVGGNPLQCRVPLAAGCGLVGIGEVTAETEAAVDRARGRRD